MSVHVMVNAGIRLYYISAVRVARRRKDNHQRNPQNITRIIIVEVVIDATSFILYRLFWPLAEQKFEPYQFFY